MSHACSHSGAIGTWTCQSPAPRAGALQHFGWCTATIWLVHCNTGALQHFGWCTSTLVHNNTVAGAQQHCVSSVGADGANMVRSQYVVRQITSVRFPSCSSANYPNFRVRPLISARSWLDNVNSCVCTILPQHSVRWHSMEGHSSDTSHITTH